MLAFLEEPTTINYSSKVCNLLKSDFTALLNIELLQVKTGAITNIRILTPIIRATIELQGEGHCLMENGGTLKCGRTWVYSVLKRLRLSYRKATTAAQKLPDNWQELGKLTALRYQLFALAQ